VLKSWHRHLVEHLLVGAAVGAPLGQLALDAVAAVRTGPVERFGLALDLVVGIVAHSCSSSVSSEAIIMAPANVEVTNYTRSSRPPERPCKIHVRIRNRTRREGV
jgi:hypothetical protein